MQVTCQIAAPLCCGLEDTGLSTVWPLGEHHAGFSVVSPPSSTYHCHLWLLQLRCLSLLSQGGKSDC